jgi:hypothetical protein
LQLCGNRFGVHRHYERKITPLSLQLYGHRFGVNLHYERKITPPKIFLRCFGVKHLAVNLHYEHKLTPPKVFLHCIAYLLNTATDMVCDVNEHPIDV